MDYSNGKIYKIVCNITGKCYIGSTCCPKLSQRLSQHRQDFKAFLNGKRSYVTSYDILERGNYEITLLESFPCNNKEELLKREREYIETLECVNKLIPIRDIEEKKTLQRINTKEYCEENKPKILENKKNYRIENKDNLADKRKIYREKNKSNIVEYRNKNRGKILEYTKNYKIENRNMILEKSREYYLSRK
jgi:hypothetical protein